MVFSPGINITTYLKPPPKFMLSQFGSYCLLLSLGLKNLNWLFVKDFFRNQPIWNDREEVLPCRHPKTSRYVDNLPQPAQSVPWNRSEFFKIPNGSTVQWVAKDWLYRNYLHMHVYIYILYICTIMYTWLSPILRVIYRDYVNRCDVYNKIWVSI